VSQIGRHLVQRTIEQLGGGTGNYDQLAAFVNTIETACLLHDIGNPPFGHLGESAVKEWFADKRNRCAVRDLAAFDGNPQGFRLATFLAGADDFGFNLTSTLLLSTVKYPWDIVNRPDGKKFGLFAGDTDNYLKACEQVQWKPGSRFPFVRLMDTADEIAYAMSDLEDGLEKQIISVDDLKATFGAKYFPSGVLKPIVAFKTSVINEAVAEAATRFCRDLDGILDGEDFDLIDETSQVGELLDKVAKFARARIYSHESAETVELAGRSVIKGLLNHFGELLKLSDSDFSVLASNDERTIKKRELSFQARLFRRLPESYVGKYKVANRGEELHRRCHLIVDFISGMTDDFALQTYQVLEGIRIK
jgi:dGTPase